MTTARFTLGLLAAVFAAGAAHAVPESLLSNSPFGAVSGPDKAAATPNRLELRGLFTLGGTPSFAIFDTSTQKAFWVGLNQAEGNVRIVGYDPATNAVSAEVDGQAQRLVMKEAQIVTMVAPPPTTPGAAGQPPVPGGPGLAPGQVASEQEVQERRNRIIEELRRRRALRSGQPQPGPGQPPQPAPAPQ